MANVRKLWIPGPTGKLEAAVRIGPGTRAAAVVAHPHPLAGGTLHTPVIFHADRELNRAGFGTLRLNFRGVGTSEGSHDEGRGEPEDVAAAISWLRGAQTGLPLLLVGFSFGAWCGLRHALGNDSVSAVVAIGLPILKYDFGFLEGFDRPLAVVQSEVDEFGSADEVEEFLNVRKPGARVVRVPSGGHLFPGKVREAGEAVAAAARSLLEL